MPHLFFLALAVCSISTLHSQSTGQDNKFVLTGKIVGRDTGAVVLWHFDNQNKSVADTVQLSRGEFHFSGTVNRVCEAMLWTDIKNLNFDDSSVIRFLLEPGDLYVSYRAHAGENAVITGSASQEEKEKLDRQKSSLLVARARVYDAIYSLNRSDPALRAQINQLSVRRDSVLEAIKAVDLQYIRQHPKSYVSAYLLSRHQRKLPVDSLEQYFGRLPGEVRLSSVGHDVLRYIYPLTENNEFRKANPLVDLEFDQRLSKLRSMYDLSLSDSSGNTIALRSFKGKYLVVEF